MKIRRTVVIPIVAVFRGHICCPRQAGRRRQFGTSSKKKWLLGTRAMLKPIRNISPQMAHSRMFGDVLHRARGVSRQARRNL